MPSSFFSKLHQRNLNRINNCVIQHTIQRKSKGFTLIEILVVIIIISIAITMTVLAFGDFGASRKATASAEHFADYIKLVEQQAILEMNTLGISISSNGYVTYRFVEDNWLEMPKNSIFQRKNFPSNLIVTVRLNNNKNKKPDIVISPSGEISPFQILFGTEVKPDLILLIGQRNGDIVIQKTKE